MLDTRNAEVLAVSRRGDGRQRVLKVLYRDRPAVMKCYGLKRSVFRSALRQFGSLVLVGKSTFTPRGRKDTEKAVLALWRRHGFDVPEILEADGTSEDGAPCLVMEWIEGPSLIDVFGRQGPTLDEKRRRISRFAGIMGERHARSLALKEPRLLFEHPSFYHVILSEDRMVHFDFEIVFTGSKRLDRLIRREIQGFLGSMAGFAPEEQLLPLVEAFASNYPDPRVLARTASEMHCYGTVPLMGWIAPFMRIKKKDKRYRLRAPLISALKQVVRAGS